MVLEAQASGLRVIVTDRGGPAEIVRRYDAGIVVDLSQPQALAHAMEKIILDADLRRELRNCGLRNAAKANGKMCWKNYGAATKATPPKSTWKPIVRSMPATCPA